VQELSDAVHGRAHSIRPRGAIIPAVGLATGPFAGYTFRDRGSQGSMGIDHTQGGACEGGGGHEHAIDLGRGGPMRPTSTAPSAWSAPSAAPPPSVLRIASRPRPALSSGSIRPHAGPSAARGIR